MESNTMCKLTTSGDTSEGRDMTKSQSTTKCVDFKSPVICKEVFDEECFPSSEEINEYAKLIGIEPLKEKHLLYLAKEGLMAALPQDWKICYSEEKSGHYYHNTRTKQSQWDHPLDEEYRNLVRHMREHVSLSSETVNSLVDQQDDGSQLDSGIRSMQDTKDTSSFFSPLSSGTKNKIVEDVPATTLSSSPFEKSACNRFPSESVKHTSETVLGRIMPTHRSFVFSNPNEDINRCKLTSNVKGILRDPSITDISRRLGSNETIHDIEDKKSVRFNLDAERQRHSLENKTLQIKTKDYENFKNENINESETCTNEAIGNDSCDDRCLDSLNPFLTYTPNFTKSLQKSESMEILKRYKNNSAINNEFLSTGEDIAESDFIDQMSKGVVNTFHEDTDSDSKCSSVRSFVLKNTEQIAGSGTFDLDEISRTHSQELKQLQLKSLQISAEKRNTTRGSLNPANKTVCETQLLLDLETTRRDNEAKFLSLQHEYELRLTSHQHALEEEFEIKIEKYRTHLVQQFHKKCVDVVSDHKLRISTLQCNHEKIIQDLEQDFHRKEDLIRREKEVKLEEFRDRLTYKMELENKRHPKLDDEKLFEKVRCEKRLLEDKYRCLKDKYIRLKTDVKLSLERRNRRREALAQQQHNHKNGTKSNTGSDTERSASQIPFVGNNENPSLSFSDKINTHEDKIKAQNNLFPTKPVIGTHFKKQLQVHDDNTSVSQSDTTISNTFNKAPYPLTLKSTSEGQSVAITLSDNGNSSMDLLGNAMMHCPENNNNSHQVKQASELGKLVFSRTKSASTSRLNSELRYKKERACSPVENLRDQLQKLEDLEDQFPAHTLDTIYHLRYPFTEMSVEHAAAGVGSELEFFKHRIHLERDSIRRAKESLRMQRSKFKLRQREIKQHHQNTPLSPKRSIENLIQEENDLTEMEVNLHRTRSLLGEKIIRLRYLEQNLLRIYEKEMLGPDLESKDDAATLSDISSHSSSGFSSTDFLSAADFYKRKDYFQQESNDCIQNLEILNFEIREILDILGQVQQHHEKVTPSVAFIPMILKSELRLSNSINQHSLATAPAHYESNVPDNTVAADSAGDSVVFAQPSIPSLADRLETYRQVAVGRMQNSFGGTNLTSNKMNAQSPRAANYTTCLVERTREMRNWLRQAKRDLLVSVGQTTAMSGVSGG
ncbi:hypothetical protein KR018_001662, partial [Drosophila ironensis]